ncbi:MAG: type II secretion system protein [Bacillota bacterium]
MKKIIKSVLIFIKSKIKKIILTNKGFTLLEIILVITIIGLLTVSSFTFINSFLDFFYKQDYNLLSTLEEKVSLLILSNDFFQAKNIVLNENELSFDGYYKEKETSITYQVYNSSYGIALGKITDQKINAIINNVKEIEFSLEGSLLLVDLLFVDSNNNLRSVKRVFNSRIK